MHAGEPAAVTTLPRAGRPTLGTRHWPAWTAFVAAHLWLTLLGVAVVPAEAFWDVDLYRWWAGLTIGGEGSPVLDEPWVYPAGALVPVVLPGLVTVTSTPGYALAWCAMVTALDLLAAAALVRRGGPAPLWWWSAFLVTLGPVALGRLDAVIAPLMVLGLLGAVTRPRSAAAVLTAGAWVKVAPGPLLLPLAAAARRPVRDVVLPAAAVSALVVVAVTAAGGGGRLLSFLATQTGRGLQVESVTATPWVVASLWRPDVVVALHEELVTYEVHGPGTAAAAAVLDGVLLVGVLAVAAVLVVARRRGVAPECVLPAAATLVLLLVVATKVGSPQFVTWLAAPVVVLLATGPRRGGRADLVLPVLVLTAAALTQVVFPWGYPALLTGHAGVTGVLAARNVVLVVLLAVSARQLVSTATAGPAAVGLRRP